MAVDRSAIVRYLIEHGEIPDPASIERVRREWTLKNVDKSLKILSPDPESYIGGKALDNFHALFVDRFQRIKKFITRKIEFSGIVDIDYISKNTGTVRFVAMVSDVRKTRYGYVLEFEDLTGTITGFCSKQCTDVPLKDDIVGVVGNISDKTKKLYVNSFEYPGVDNIAKKEKIINTNTAIAITSDVHVGSKMFFEQHWLKFIDWLNSGNDQARRIKYLILAGDLVDGIGIYPGQENDLKILDIYKQYEQLAKYLSKIPNTITIVMIPGNHDIVRVAEPQPALPPAIQELFSDNVIFLSNPSRISILGYELLLYHGGSLNDLVELLPGMSYKKPDLMMQELIKRRHLSPVYGNKVPIVPMKRDFLVIDTIPDLFIAGHIHTYAATMYHGVGIVNASTWQAQTQYQKMLNFVPDPCKVIIKNLDKPGFKTLKF